MDETSNKLKRLHQFGQSPWYDNIDRRLIENGELKKLFEMGILGVTSNPTIFEKAVLSSNVYDEKIKALKSSGKTIEEIYNELTIDDVRDVADMLKDVYEKTKKTDGYVSIEVPPSCAHDSDKTIEYAVQISKKLGRENIMIKVPATQESYIAIRALIREGINVNATLIFSIAHYELVANAYIDGLNDRINDGKDVSSVASVASVFISRIDTKIDSLLDVFSTREQDIKKRQKIDSYKGKVAISNAKCIYGKFKELFGDLNFGNLKSSGARVQRPLWASTSTKNPCYSDVLYVNNLIGPFTVNTMPHETVSAFANHGRIALTLESNIDEAPVFLEGLKELDINIDVICQEAQVAGIGAFERSFQTMFDSIKQKVSS